MKLVIFLLSVTNVTSLTIFQSGALRGWAPTRWLPWPRPKVSAVDLDVLKLARENKGLTQQTIFDERVDDHMTPSDKLLMLSPDDTVKHAAQLLLAAKVTGAPVVEDGRLVGVLSRTDLLYKLAGLRSLFGAGQGPRSLRYMDNTARITKVQAETVRDCMTSNVITLRPETTMQDAAATMLHRKLNRIMVATEAGELLGIVTASDVVRLTLCEDPIGEECAAFAN